MSPLCTLISAKALSSSRPTFGPRLKSRGREFSVANPWILATRKPDFRHRLPLRGLSVPLCLHVDPKDCRFEISASASQSSLAEEFLRVDLLWQKVLSGHRREGTTTALGGWFHLPRAGARETVSPSVRLLPWRAHDKALQRVLATDAACAYDILQLPRQVRNVSALDAHAELLRTDLERGRSLEVGGRRKHRFSN